MEYWSIDGTFQNSNTPVLQHSDLPILRMMLMDREDAAYFPTKDGPDAVVDALLRETLLRRALQGKLPCALAFDVAKGLGVLPDVVGRAADLLELRLVKCQLGLFGYRSKKSIVRRAASVPQELEDAILAGLINDRLPCKTAWGIARQFGIHKMRVSAACDTMGIKIKPCQLGAF